MTEPSRSASWYRIARLRPRLRSHARMHRHRYRGQLWYVLQDPASGRCHRLSPAAYQIVGRMDGERSTGEIWEAACAELGDDAPTQGETLRLLGQLHAIDLLGSDVSPDVAEILRRAERRSREERRGRWSNPLSVRVPLWDPHRFLERALPWVRPLFSRPAAGALLALVGVACVQAVLHRAELLADASARLLDPRSLFWLALVYPVLKAFHELGHAFAARVWGGAVHELGILFLVGMPLPYVDASSAAAFPEKSRRTAVGAAGIAVELGLASLALFVWLAVEPGWLREAASHVMWIGAVSTLLFNGNPLLRFDGYYVLADALEIPNLAARSQQYWGWWVLHRLFGLEHVRSPVHAPGEAKWLAAYGVASFLYRMSVLLGIALFLASRFFVVGVALAIYALLTQVVWPTLRHAAFLLSDPRLGERRGRAIGVSLGLGVALPVLALALPAPSRTLAEGVVWPPPGAEVRAGADGFVAGLRVEPGRSVGPGDPLIETRDETLVARVAVAEARLRELRARHFAEQIEDRVRAEILGEELASAEAELARLRDQAGAGVVRSPGRGRFVPVANDLTGRYVRQGELLGWVLEASALSTARVVVAQSEVARIRQRTRAVALRLSRDPERVLPARLEREVPAATNRLPSAALGALGGGRLAIDRSDPEGLRTAETVFQLDVGFDPREGVPEMGGRVLARFDHGWEALGFQLWRGARGLLLSRLGV